MEGTDSDSQTDMTVFGIMKSTVTAGEIGVSAT